MLALSLTATATVCVGPALLLCTQVLVKSTGERVYYPTTRLITLPVINLTRTTAKSEKVVFLLDLGKAGTAAREALLVSGYCQIPLLP